MPEIWERRQSETRDAYGAFLLYRNLGENRTVLDAYFSYMRRPVHRGAQASGQWKGWSKRHEWNDRAKAWDQNTPANVRAQFLIPPPARVAPEAEPPRQPQAASPNPSSAPTPVETAPIPPRNAARPAHWFDVAGVGNMTDEAQIDWAAERQAARMAELNLSRKLMEKANEMLAIAVVEEKHIPPDPERGRPAMTIIKPCRWSFKTVAEIIQTASMIRRLATELPTKVAMDDNPNAADEDQMFATTIGRLESVLPTGVVPMLPADPTQAPPNSSVVIEGTEIEYTQPVARRPRR